MEQLDVFFLFYFLWILIFIFYRNCSVNFVIWVSPLSYIGFAVLEISFLFLKVVNLKLLKSVLLSF